MPRIRWAFKKATLAEGRGRNGGAGGWSRGISWETSMRIWEKSNPHLNLAKAQLWRQEPCRAFQVPDRTHLVLINPHKRPAKEALFISGLQTGDYGSEVELLGEI